MRFIFVKLKKTYSRRRRNIINPGGRNSAYVLGIVLIIISMIAMLSAEFLSSAVTALQTSSSAVISSQATLYAETGFRVAEIILDADKRGMTGSLNINTDKNTDSYDDIWARNIPSFDIDGYSIKILIRDEQSKINVNSIYNEFTVSSATYPYIILKNFFNDMGFDENYPESILDYIDKDDSKSQYGAETYDYYSRFSAPGKAKNTWLVSLNELMMIKNFSWPVFAGITGGNRGIEGKLTDKNYELKELFPEDEDIQNASTDKEILTARETSRNLSDYLRVDGENGDATNEINRININTAPFRVLIAIPGMTDGMAEEIISKRKVKPLSSISEISGIITDQVLREKHLTVASSIFSIRVIVSFSGKSIETYGIYNRNEKKYYYLKTL